MNKTLLIHLCIITLLVVSVIGFTYFSGEAQAPTSEIIVEDADYVSLNDTEYSPDLINIAGNVTPRVVLEYGESLAMMGLYDSLELKQAAGIVSPRMVVEYADSIFEQNLQRAQNLTEKANIVKPRIIVEYADSIVSADLERPFVTTFMGFEKSFTESSLVENFSVQKANLNNVLVTGDLNGTLDFTNLEIIIITTGPFTGKGFSKGAWRATLEGVSYTGDWRGALFLKPSERKICLKGSLTGELTGTVEGYLTESVAGRGIYDLYKATWMIGRINVTTTSATINLSGTLAYQSQSEFPASEIYALQTSVEGTSSGHFNSPLSIVLTHIRIVNGTPYNGEGFSIISYTCDFGTGEGWTYDKLASPKTLTLKGLFTNPLYGVVSAILDESKMPRTLHIIIERVDLGLPPTADLKVRIWGPERVSPGQTVTYCVELRNEGFKGCENVTLQVNLPASVKIISYTDNGHYNLRTHKIIWFLEEVPAKAGLVLIVTGTLEWGLPFGTIVELIANIPPKEIEVNTDPTLDVVYHILESAQNFVRAEIEVSNQTVSQTLYSEIYISGASEKIEPTFNFTEVNDEVTLSFRYTVEGSSYKVIEGSIKGSKKAYEIYTLYKRFRGVMVEATEMANFLEWLKINDYISREQYYQLYDSYIAKTIFSLGGPSILKQVPLLGPVYSWLTDKILDGFMSIFKRQIYMCIYLHMDATGRDPPESLEEVYKIYLDEISLAVSSAKSVVVTARDPNIKYGPFGYVSQGQVLNYSIEYENEGEGIAFGVYFTDTLDMGLDDSTLEIGPVISTKDGSVIAGPGTYNPATRTITWLVGEVGPGEVGYANFSIKVRNDVPVGTEIVNFATVYFPNVPEITSTNAIISVVGQPNIAVTNVSPSELVIGIGSTACVNVTVLNEGYFSETLNITLYANTTAIQTRNVFLLPQSSDTLMFLWNTTEFAIGNYTISAYAYPITGEIDTSDNVQEFFSVQVIPEFPSAMILPLFMLTTLIVIILLRNEKKLKN